MVQTNIYYDLGCEGKSCDGGSRKTNKTGTSPEQQYMLFPNPNEGSMQLQQYYIDNSVVNIEILNETGMSVYKNEILFNKGSTNIKLENVSTGIYILKLLDNNGGTYNLKFTVIK